MVLESLTSPQNAEKKPYKMIFLGVLYTIVAAFLSLWIFPTQGSFTIVFFTAMAAIPFLAKLINFEEAKDFQFYEEFSLLKEHAKAIKVMLYLFIGITIACAGFFALLPQEKANTLFSIQAMTLNKINPHQTVGKVIGFAQGFPTFNKIFFNNIKVMIFCILFSFIYGAGAIFVLSWNASVIGTAIGNFIIKEIAALETATGFSLLLQQTLIVITGLFKYVIHGIPEIGAYIIAALAGGIISISIIKHDLTSKKFEHIVLDASDLILLSMLLIFVSAILEVYITPLVF